jgi:O-antigen/teichoic acid export membrane protein
MIGWMRRKIETGDARTVEAKKNIAYSFALKAVSILISLGMVPLTIHYVNPTRYGIWLTLSSLITIVTYFDFGFTHGFRNRFAEAVAKGNVALAKEYVSTTYFALAIVFAALFAVLLLVNGFVDWSAVLKVPSLYRSELGRVAVILLLFVCLTMVANTFTTMLTAYQKPALAAAVQTAGQFLAFIAIWVLTKTTAGSLTHLAWAYMGMPFLVLAVLTLTTFRQKTFRPFCPSLHTIRPRYIKDILGLGLKFFIIMVSLLFIFQFINIIISRVEGPDAVTRYNVAYKYMNVLAMSMMIVLTPFWSAFTDAFTKKDYRWMELTRRKLEKMWLLSVPIAVVMLFAADTVYRLWVGRQIHISFTLSCAVMVYTLATTLGNIYMYMLNGIGKVMIQLIVYTLFAICSIPLMYWFCRWWGVSGLLIVPTAVYFFQALLGRVQLSKLCRGKAKGIWNI